jgi:RNA polymerase-interacting CarD/CdnL/TRCF family regulator
MSYLAKFKVGDRVLYEPMIPFWAKGLGTVSAEPQRDRIGGSWYYRIKFDDPRMLDFSFFDIPEFRLSAPGALEELAGCGR